MKVKQKLDKELEKELFKSLLLTNHTSKPSLTQLAILHDSLISEIQSFFPSHDWGKIAENELKKIEREEAVKKVINCVGRNYLLNCLIIYFMLARSSKLPTPNCPRPDYKKELSQIAEGLFSLKKKGFKSEEGMLLIAQGLDKMLLSNQAHNPWGLFDLLNKKERGRTKEFALNCLIKRIGDALREKKVKYPWKLMEDFFGHIAPAKDSIRSSETIKVRYHQITKNPSNYFILS